MVRERGERGREEGERAKGGDGRKGEEKDVPTELYTKICKSSWKSSRPYRHSRK